MVVQCTTKMSLVTDHVAIVRFVIKHVVIIQNQLASLAWVCAVITLKRRAEIVSEIG